MILFGENTPMPTPTSTVPPELVTPGFGGFAVVAVLVIAVILLIWDMNRRVRRVRYRDEVREELDAEQAELDEQQNPSATGTTEAADDSESGNAPGR